MGTRNGWAPRWAIASVESSKGLTSLDVVGQDLFMFHQRDRRTKGGAPTIEVLNLDTGIICGLWELPRSVMGVGCAMTDNDVYVLSEASGVERSLVQGDLEMS